MYKHGMFTIPSYGWFMTLFYPHSQSWVQAFSTCVASPVIIGQLDGDHFDAFTPGGGRVVIVGTGTVMNRVYVQTKA